MSEYDPKRIGGSDAGPIILGTPRTAGDVYLRIVDGVESPDSFYAAAGRAMEPVIRAEVERELGVRIVKPEPLFFGRYPAEEGSILRASPDGIIEGIGELWECKLTWSLDEYGTEGTDEVPHHHLLQVQFYMHAFNIDRCRLTVRPIWGSRNQHYLIDRNRRLGEKIAAKLVAFWFDHIVPQRPPPILDPVVLDKAYPGSYPNAKQRPCVLADEKIGRALELLKVVRQREAYLTAVKEALELDIKNYIGAAAGVEHMGERVTWLRPKPKKVINWEAVAMRQRLLLSGICDGPVVGDEWKPILAEIERECTEEKQQARRFYVPREWTKAVETQTPENRSALPEGGTEE